jgi:hypothetical protein
MDQQTLAVVGGAASVATAIFWGAFGLGRIWAQISDHDLRLRRLEGRK